VLHGIGGTFLMKSQNEKYEDIKAGDLGGHCKLQKCGDIWHMLGKVFGVVPVIFIKAIQKI
jgi:hypothetical protein